MSSMARARACGFHDATDTAAMFERQLAHYRATKTTP